LSQFCRDVAATQQRAEATKSLTAEQGVAFYAAHGVILHGWARVMRGQHETGLAEMRQGSPAILIVEIRTYRV
jgi:hypothetical protein